MHPIWTQKSTRPGISDAALAAWKQRTGPELPEVLATLLRQHDGGELEHHVEPGDLYPLAEMKPVDAAFCEKVWQIHPTMERWQKELEKSGISPDTELFPCVRKGNAFYWFAWLDGAADPVMIKRDWDDFKFFVREPLDAWCRTDLAPPVSTQSGVVWDEVLALEVIFEEKCIKDGCVEMNQVLGRKDGVLWLYTHEVLQANGTVKEESYSKHQLPEPFDPELSEVEKDGKNWFLPLTPENSEGCVEYVSRRNESSGGWIDDNDLESEGAHVESPDRKKIEALHRLLVDTES